MYCDRLIVMAWRGIKRARLIFCPAVNLSLNCGQLSRSFTLFCTARALCAVFEVVTYSLIHFNLHDFSDVRDANIW